MRVCTRSENEIDGAPGILSMAKKSNEAAQGSRRCLFAALCTYREMNQVSASKPGRCLLLTRRGHGTALFPPPYQRPLALVFFLLLVSLLLLISQTSLSSSFFHVGTYIVARRPPSPSGFTSELLPLSFAPLQCLGSGGDCKRRDSYDYRA